jgi:hypothetical protein
VSGRDALIVSRLVELARARAEDPNLTLNRFGLERLLHRLSVSQHADRFLLKGALLFALWYDEPHRPTRDADLLAFGSDDAQRLVELFRTVAAIELHDGIVFDTSSIRADAIREDNRYGGLRLRLTGSVARTRCSLQVDIGFGDAVTPSARRVTYPVLLAGYAQPRLRVYPVYSVISEKYEAMVMLGLANSRMKDFYDVCVIARRTSLDGATLARAIANTFERRGTALPGTPPVALTAAFAQAADKQRQWGAFLGKNRLANTQLADTVRILHDLLWPPTQVAATGSNAGARWLPDRLAWA